MTPLSPPSATRLPNGFVIRLARGLQRPAPDVLLTDAPARLLRLSPAALPYLAGVDNGQLTVHDDVSAALARRLLDTGAAHPVPTQREADPAEVTARVTLVIPVRDRADQLATLLGVVAGVCQVVVVDDASGDPVPIAGVCAGAGARLIRRDVNGGPGESRNTGLQYVETELVAFCDSDCRPQPDWLARLIPLLDDPATAVVAPRVRGDCAAGRASRRDTATGTPRADRWADVLHRFEALHSPHDLGAVPARVQPLGRVSYVPSAAWLARRCALGDGFTPGLRVGEDVDLVWRLHRAGWTVRYEPSVSVRHRGRGALGPWVSQRVGYGRAAAPLSRDHPGWAPPLAAHPATVAAWVAAAGPLPWGPLLATGIIGGSVGLLARRLPLATAAQRYSFALRYAGLGSLRSARQVPHAAVRQWWPVALPLLGLAPRRVQVALAGGWLWDALRDRSRESGEVPEPLGLGPYLALRLADDLSYGTGLWAGALTARSTAALRPRLDAGRIAGPARQS